MKQPGCWRSRYSSSRPEQLAEAERSARDYLGDVTALEPVGRDELYRRIQAGGVLVLDVRPDAEYAVAHILGAVGIPDDELSGRLSELLGDAEVVAYCRGRYCMMAPAAVRILRQHGYAARSLAGGLPEWRRAGLPVTTGAAALPHERSRLLRASDRPAQGVCWWRAGQ